MQKGVVVLLWISEAKQRKHKQKVKHICRKIPMQILLQKKHRLVSSFWEHLHHLYSYLEKNWHESGLDSMVSTFHKGGGLLLRSNPHISPWTTALCSDSSAFCSILIIVFENSHHLNHQLFSMLFSLPFFQMDWNGKYTINICNSCICFLWKTIVFTVSDLGHFRILKPWFGALYQDSKS